MKVKVDCGRDGFSRVTLDPEDGTLGMFCSFRMFAPGHFQANGDLIKGVGGEWYTEESALVRALVESMLESCLRNRDLATEQIEACRNFLNGSR